MKSPLTSIGLSGGLGLKTSLGLKSLVICINVHSDGISFKRSIRPRYPFVTYSEFNDKHSSSLSLLSEL